jgi:pimeloyl-ACP methyl ester carboxylesterase
MELLFAEFRLDVGQRRLHAGAREIKLQPKTFDLLVLLCRRAGELLSRETIYEILWPNLFVDDHSLSVQIADLRKALGDSPKQPRLIETRARVGYRFLPKVVEAAEFEEPQTRYARSGEFNIAYQVLGQGPVDLVFVMGWVSHLEYFWREPHFKAFLLRLAGFSRLILFDKRGTGLSDRVPNQLLPTLEERMDDVRAVMEAVGSERAAILGVSEGGPMSALFAATYPEKTLGLAMVGSYARRLRDEDYPWGPTAEEREAYLIEIRKGWGGPIGIEDRAPSLAKDAAFREWWATYLRMGVSPGGAEALTRMNASIDVRPILPSVRVPTLVLHRKEDKCLLVEEGRYLASLIPGAQFVELPGADHLPFTGPQEDILQQIENFLAAVQIADAPESQLATVVVLRLWERLGGWKDMIEKELRRHRGQSHGSLYAFDGPARAVRFAFALGQQVSREGFQFGAALHTGECLLGGQQEPKGPAVAFARAILELGEEIAPVLCSRVIRDLVAGSGIEFSAVPKTEISFAGEAWPIYDVVSA